MGQRPSSKCFAPYLGEFRRGPRLVCINRWGDEFMKLMEWNSLAVMGPAMVCFTTARHGAVGGAASGLRLWESGAWWARAGQITLEHEYPRSGPWEQASTDRSSLPSTGKPSCPLVSLGIFAASWHRYIWDGTKRHSTSRSGHCSWWPWAVGTRKMGRPAFGSIL